MKLSDLTEGSMPNRTQQILHAQQELIEQGWDVKLATRWNTTGTLECTCPSKMKDSRNGTHTVHVAPTGGGLVRWSVVHHHVMSLEWLLSHMKRRLAGHAKGDTRWNRRKPGV